MKTVPRTALLILPALLAGCEVGDFIEGARYREPFHFTFNANPGVRLTVETQNGEV